MSAQVMYRIATVDDVEQLVHLRTLMQCELNNLDPLKDFVEFKKATRAYFLESIKNGSYACGVAEISGLIVSTSGVIL